MQEPLLHRHRQARSLYSKRKSWPTLQYKQAPDAHRDCTDAGLSRLTLPQYVITQLIATQSTARQLCRTVFSFQLSASTGFNPTVANMFIGCSVHISFTAASNGSASQPELLRTDDLQISP